MITKKPALAAPITLSLSPALAACQDQERAAVVEAPFDTPTPYPTPTPTATPYPTYTPFPTPSSTADDVERQAMRPRLGTIRDRGTGHLRQPRRRARLGLRGHRGQQRRLRHRPVSGRGHRGPRRSQRHRDTPDRRSRTRADHPVRRDRHDGAHGHLDHGPRHPVGQLRPYHVLRWPELHGEEGIGYVQSARTPRHHRLRGERHHDGALPPRLFGPGRPEHRDIGFREHRRGAEE